MKSSKLSLVGLVAAAGIILPAIAMGNADPKTTTPTSPTSPTAPAAPAAPATTPAPAATPTKQDHKDHKVADAAAKVGSIAPPFTLTDTDGKTVNLSDFTGKIVVIQWFNPGCPFVKKHYENGANTFNDLSKKYSDKGVVFVAINSGAAGKEGAGKEANAAVRKEWKIDYPILIDDSGKIGKLYGAKHTPEMYIVNKDGTLAYHGAIDDDSGMKGVGKTNYVAKALDELLANKKVSTAETKPYGCSVKYGS